MSGRGIYPNAPTYENTDDYISNITGSAPKNPRQSVSTIGDDFDRQKLYGTDNSPTKRYEAADDSCGTCCIKFFLFILNAVFLAAGGFVVAMGIIVLTKEQFHVIGKTLPIIVICVGVGLLLFAIYGCIAAKVNNRCLLVMYLILLVVLLLLFLGVCTALVIFDVKPDILKDPATEGWKEAVAAGNSGPFSACKLQRDWGCSGWANDTVCDDKHVSPTCPSCPTSEYYPTANGNCWSFLTTSIKNNIIMLIIGAGSATAVVLFAIIFTCCLCRRKVGVLSSEKLLYSKINEYKL